MHKFQTKLKLSRLKYFILKKNDNKLYDFLLNFDRKFGDVYSIRVSGQPASKSNKGYIIAQNDCEYPMVLKLWKPDAFLPEIGHTNCETVIIQPTECVLIFSRDIQSGIGYNVHNIIPKNASISYKNPQYDTANQVQTITDNQFLTWKPTPNIIFSFSWNNMYLLQFVCITSA